MKNLFLFLKSRVKAVKLESEFSHNASLLTWLLSSLLTPAGQILAGHKECSSADQSAINQYAANSIITSVINS